MYKLFKLLFYLMIGAAYIGLQSCSSDDEPDTPSNQERIIGYWAITHIRTIEQQDGITTTKDVNVPPHGIDSYVTEDNPRWDVLIFDKDFVTVRGDMPSRPKGKDYDLDVIEGQVEYIEALDNWENSFGDADENACPKGRYHFSGSDLIVNALNLGKVNFISDNEFTLDYTKHFKNVASRQLIYTYSRIYSLKAPDDWTASEIPK